MEYKEIKDITPGNMACVIGSCPAIYEATKTGEESYLIIGRVVSPREAGLEVKVGEGEILIEIPRELFANLK